MYGCQQILIHTSEDVKAILEFICGEANKLANCGIYYCRQMLFKNNRFVSKYDLDTELKNNPHFKAMRSACAQQILHDVVESFTSYKRLKSLWHKGQLENKPKPPNYRKKGGMCAVSCPARWIKLVEDKFLKIPLGKQVKAWFGIDSFMLPMPSNLDFKAIKEFRIVPRNNCFYLECIYLQKEITPVESNLNALGIDQGLDNWLTCVSNTGKSFIIDGKKVKSQNQWFNKKITLLKKDKPHGYWDDELAKLTEKRNRQMKDNINKAARFIISWCLTNNVSIIVFGWNQRQKDSINLGKKVNQEFTQIPTAKLKNRLAQLCEQYGIKFVENEESYTSKSSFLDNDLLPIVGAKPDGWQPSGKRIKRGLYRTATGKLINCDCQGAVNILKKVATQLGITLAKVGREVLTLPERYGLTRLSKFYRKRCEASIYCASTTSV
jgi:putative transposase